MGGRLRTAPNDGFAEIVQNFKSGVTAMLIHHVNSSVELSTALKDDVDVVPMPSGTKGLWVPCEACSIALSSASKFKNAAADFAHFSLQPEVHSQFCQEVSQVPFIDFVTKEEKFTKNKFVDASMKYVKDTKIFPVVSTWGDWSEKVWPQTMQRALLGEIDSAQMMKILADALAGKKP